MHSPTVSVVIRTTHRATLTAAIASVERQTHRPLELVLVDARGSGFVSPPNVAGDIALVTVSHGQSLGYSEAANAGLDAAHGQYIVYLDDDDFFDREHIACRLEALDRAEAVDGRRPLLAYGPTRRVDEHGAEQGVMDEEHSPIRLHHHNYIQIGAALFSRQLIDKGCRFDPPLGGIDDWDFWLQASVYTPFAYTPLVTNNWCATGGGSGSGVSQNFDTTRFHRLHRLLMAKWQTRHEILLTDFERHSNIAFDALQRGDLIAAEASYREAMRLDASDASVLGNMAFIRMQQGDVPAAMLLLARAIKHNPQVIDARINLAMLHAQTGNAGESLRVVDALLAIDARNERALALRAKLTATAGAPRAA